MPTNFQPEEQLIIDCLRRYGCLKMEQLLHYVYYKPREIVTKIINGLAKKRILVVDDSGNVRLDHRCDYNSKTEIAFWVLLKYLEKINYSDHYAANFPSQIYFLKEKKQFEIIVLGNDEDHLLGVIANSDRGESVTGEDDDEMRYIVVVPTETMANVCRSRLKNRHVMIATYNPEFAPGTDPEIKFLNN